MAGKTGARDLPNGAGTAIDFVCRAIGDRLARALGQQFVVENLVGASGIVGAQAAARAPNDGYTVFFAPASTLTSNIYQFKSLPYDPQRDLTAVAIVVDAGPFILSVHPDVPAQNLAEFIAYAKAQAGKLSYAVDVSSGYGVILGQWFNKTAGTMMEEISYKSAAQALQDTVAGRTQAIISSVPTTRPFAVAGRLRSLAISSSKRFTTLDTLPTMAETIPAFQLVGWFALMVPTGTSASIIDRLNREVDRILQDNELVQRMLNVGLGSSGAGTPQAANDFIRAERERWARIAKDIGIQPQ
ncbi:MAG: tripartite tricarboxylate transporter substrate binding protein [Betaproteobacteria bacterium]|nr:tripartite tricarboxylate transporter substrate binding protein [Betaproteobacteria bacterium]